MRHYHDNAINFLLIFNENTGSILCSWKLWLDIYYKFLQLQKHTAGMYIYVFHTASHWPFSPFQFCPIGEIHNAQYGGMCSLSSLYFPHVAYAQVTKNKLFEKCWVKWEDWRTLLWCAILFSHSHIWSFSKQTLVGGGLLGGNEPRRKHFTSA